MIKIKICLVAHHPIFGDKLMKTISVMSSYAKIYF